MNKIFLWLIISIVSVILIATFSLTGCKEEGSVEKEAVEEEAAPEEQKIVLAMVARDISDPFHAIMADGAAGKCEELGIEFVLKDSQNNMDTQLNLVDNLISIGVD